VGWGEFQVLNQGGQVVDILLGSALGERALAPAVSPSVVDQD
jgi:hypothetical protein